jgi:hypothetical protein
VQTEQLDKLITKQKHKHMQVSLALQDRHQSHKTLFEPVAEREMRLIQARRAVRRSRPMPAMRPVQAAKGASEAALAFLASRNAKIAAYNAAVEGLLATNTMVRMAERVDTGDYADFPRNELYRGALDGAALPYPR